MDFAALSTALVADLTGVLTDATPVISLTLGAILAWKLYRRFIGGR